MASKKIIFRIKEGAQPESFIPFIPLSSGFKIERLYDISNEVNSILSSDFLTMSNLDINKFFDNNIYPSKPEVDKKLYRTYKIKLNSDEDAKSIYKNFKDNPDIEYVQFDELNELYYTPNDPLFGKLWGLQKIKCKEAWDISLGDSILVAVIDTGVDYNHIDIVNNIWINANGKHGKDFIDKDDDPMDYHGHGTHVAGTIAAIINNNIGITGVAPKTKILCVKIFPNPLDSVCAEAIKYAIDNGARILNNSWGSPVRRVSNPAVEDAIDYAYSRGGIVIFAAGNSGDDVKYYSPANYSKVISVASTNINDQRASDSNYGNLITVSAPGVEILSLKNGSNDYALDSGTSMAAPHVSGLVALMLSLNPNLSFEQIKTIIQNNVDFIASDKPIGTGRINAQKCLNGIAALAIIDK